MIGIPFDRPVVGYGGRTINTLRLWAAAAPDYFDFEVFSHGEFVGAVAEELAAESLTRVLYPDDSTIMGQGLRFVQEYFLVACSLADLVRRFLRSNTDWNIFPDKVAIQLNDTHPTMAVPELDADPAGRGEARMGPGVGHHAARACLHKPHAASRGAREMAGKVVRDMLPRHLEIIYEINRRLIDEVRTTIPRRRGRIARVSLIEEGAGPHVRMANLAIVGSHSTNGVAAIHSELLRTVTVRDLADMFPERLATRPTG